MRARRDGNTRLVMLPLEFMQLLSNGSSVAARSTGSRSAVGRNCALTVPFTGAIESALGELHRSWPGQR